MWRDGASIDTHSSSHRIKGQLGPGAQASAAHRILRKRPNFHMGRTEASGGKTSTWASQCRTAMSYDPAVTRRSLTGVQDGGILLILWWDPVPRHTQLPHLQAKKTERGNRPGGHKSRVCSLTQSYVRGKSRSPWVTGESLIPFFQGV